MKVTLTINGRIADLNEDGLILLTYQSTDAEHPAAVKNSYSQNITLPSTANNDAIFSHILRSDFKTGSGFNPLARTPFEIRNEAQEILVSGYLKLNSGEVGKGYDISLFGGLGGFFYSLMYNEDGTKRTLADMQWKDGTFKPASDISIDVSASDFATRYNGTFDASLPYAFAPFNEGIPQDFDASKAYYKTDGNYETYQNVYTTEFDASGNWEPKNGEGNGVIIELSNEHDAWAMQEFRNTLQRPMWGIKAFLDAICQSANNGGYDVFIDDTFYDSNFVKRGWVTLKNEWADKIVDDTVTFADLLAETQSPADYLLSIAKICGLMFAFEETTHRIQILTRDAYYGRFQSKRFSLHGMIAEDRGKTITPMLTSDKWQVLSAENYGGKAEDFAERVRRQYGSLWLNTNYEFGGNEKELFPDSAFKGAADVLATDIHYRVFPYAIYGTTSVSSWFKFSRTDTAKITLFRYPSGATEQESKSFDVSTQIFPVNTVDYNTDAEYSLFTELPEFHDADGKNEEGSDVILFYTGNLTLPQRVYFCATDTPAEMLELNGDKPCWNLYHPAENLISQFPVFRRQLGTTWSALFARPGEFFTPDPAYYDAVPAAKYLGERTWSKWLKERCNVDVRRMKCWVNLRSGVTPKVGADLLSYFWYYEGAWWVLDKINAHSLTTDALTECEFIKVVDISAYLQGQDYG